MRCIHFEEIYDADKKSGRSCSCLKGFFSDETYEAAIYQFCHDCTDKETDKCCEVYGFDEDEE